MSKRVLACLFILAVFPLLTSPAHAPGGAPPLAAVAFAGHVNSGGGAYCQCGCPGCECDPGESPSDCTRINRAAPPEAGGAAGRGDAPKGKGGGPGLDYGTGAMVLVMALWLWARLRA
ncbi:MAG TPA: hypothetical protein VJZ91_03385 [Blastocatellia bacterium]|nr:hypothetical protein [Blastocatellia bacterium]